MEYIIDVRTPEEFANGHYQGAINHEFLLIQEGLLPEYNTAAAIYVYADQEDKSIAATELLRESGFVDVTNLGIYDPELEITTEQV